jgi:hypothetical protein
MADYSSHYYRDYKDRCGAGRRQHSAFHETLSPIDTVFSQSAVASKLASGALSYSGDGSTARFASARGSSGSPR